MIDPLLTPYNPEGLTPPATAAICDMAELSTSLVDVSRSYERDSGLLHTATAIAAIRPLRTIVGRARRTSKFIDPLDERSTHTSSDPEEPIVINARREVLARALFEHLSTNCITCPKQDTCNAQAVLADVARHPERAVE